MKIDLHVHSKERSGCGRATEDEQVRAAVDAGLDAIAFTDHRQFTPDENLFQLNQKYSPFRVYGGIEISIDGEDLVVLGMSDKRLTQDCWSYPEVHAIIRDCGGFIALVHPFRYHPEISIDIEKYPPDAMEVYSANTPRHAEKQIIDVAMRHGIPLLSNSDAHATEFLGKYCNILNRVPADESDLFDILRQGQFQIKIIE
jgi:predicted metal-dependent phosphoesterase TrpH